MYVSKPLLGTQSNGPNSASEMGGKEGGRWKSPPGLGTWRTNLKGTAGARKEVRNDVALSENSWQFDDAGTRL